MSHEDVTSSGGECPDCGGPKPEGWERCGSCRPKWKLTGNRMNRHHLNRTSGRRYAAQHQLPEKTPSQRR